MALAKTLSQYWLRIQSSLFPWLEEAVSSSGVLIWLVDSLGFVRGLLPEAIRGSAAA